MRPRWLRVHRLFEGFYTVSIRVYMGVSENRGPSYRTLNSRILIIRLIRIPK